MPFHTVKYPFHTFLGVVAFSDRLSLYLCRMKKTMIMLCAVLQLCACGGGHKETDDVADTTERSPYEVVAIVPDTVVGRFIEPNRVDTLLFRTYSEKENRYIDSLPMYESWEDFVDWERERNNVIRVELIDGRLLRTISEPDRIYDLHCLNDFIRPGVDALGIAEEVSYEPSKGIVHFISLYGGNWKEFAIFDADSSKPIYDKSLLLD